MKIIKSFLFLLFFMPFSALGKSQDVTYDHLSLFADILDIVQKYHVQDINGEDLIDNAIQGMLNSLDAHTVYLKPQALEDTRSSTRGEFGGIGIEFELRDGMINVIMPINGTPAHKAGLLPGDMISHVDGKRIKGMNLSDVVHSMRGVIGSNINLTIARDGKEPFDVILTRAKISVNPVKFRSIGNIGYLRLTTFSQKATNALRKAITTLESEISGGARAYILDLRNNPGGLLQQAINVSNLFLVHGEIVSTRGRGGKVLSLASASMGDIIDKKPLIVLINGASASASEIVAGALQSQQRSTTLGTTSYGKGSVQSILSLGERGALKITTALYYTASGEKINGHGIIPDIIVSQKEAEKSVLSLEETIPEEKTIEAMGIPKEIHQDRQLSYALLLLQPISHARQ